MSKYTLHIDIPLGDEKEHAIYKSKLLIQEFFKLQISTGPNLIYEKYDIDQAGCRLGRDEDYEKSNYLEKDKNGQISNKKTFIDLKSS
jgi:hypothetical protein